MGSWWIEENRIVGIGRTGRYDFAKHLFGITSYHSVRTECIESIQRGEFPDVQGIVGKKQICLSHTTLAAIWSTWLQCECRGKWNWKIPLKKKTENYRFFRHDQCNSAEVVETWTEMSKLRLNVDFTFVNICRSSIWLVHHCNKMLNCLHCSTMPNSHMAVVKCWAFWPPKRPNMNYINVPLSKRSQQRQIHQQHQHRLSPDQNQYSTKMKITFIIRRTLWRIKRATFAIFWCTPDRHPYSWRAKRVRCWATNVRWLQQIVANSIIAFWKFVTTIKIK